MNTQHGPGQSSGSPASLEGRARDLASSAKDRFGETLEQAQAVAQEQYDKLAGSIRRNPLQAAGIAAGIGFVLALVARR